MSLSKIGMYCNREKRKESIASMIGHNISVSIQSLFCGAASLFIYISLYTFVQFSSLKTGFLGCFIFVFQNSYLTIHCVSHLWHKQ